MDLNIWSRYVDDVFATVSNKEEALLILEFLNKQHGNIKFTIDYEKQKKLRSAN